MKKPLLDEYDRMLMRFHPHIMYTDGLRIFPARKRLQKEIDRSLSSLLDKLLDIKKAVTVK